MDLETKFEFEKPKWITIELEDKIRAIFEDKYQRQLENREVLEIAINLSNFMEVFSNKDKCYDEPNNR